MKTVLRVLLFVLIQAELAAIVLGGSHANELIMRFVLRPPPPWDVFSVQSDAQKDI